MKIKLKHGGFVEITPEQITRWQNIYKNINVEAEVNKIINSCYDFKQRNEKGVLKVINEQLQLLNEKVLHE